MTVLAVVPTKGRFRVAQIGWKGATPVVECDDAAFVREWHAAIIAGFDLPIDETVEHDERPNRRRFSAGFEPGTRCSYCLKVVQQIERDHIVPFSAGGTESYDNITPACRSCNAKKRDRSLLTFVALGGILGDDLPEWETRVAARKVS